MKKYLIIAISAFAIFSGAHFARATVVFSDLNNGGSLRTGNSPYGGIGFDMGAKTVTHGTTYYILFQGLNLYDSACYAGGGSPSQVNMYASKTDYSGIDNTYKDENFIGTTHGGGDITGTVTSTFTNVETSPTYPNLVMYTSCDSYANVNQFTATAGTFITAGVFNDAIWTGSPQICIADAAGDVEPGGACYGGTGTPSIAFYFPTNSTTTSEFSTWEFSIGNVTTTDEYNDKVFYSPFGTSVTYYDENYFYPDFPSGITPLNKSVALSAYGTSTSWTAYAYLYDVTAGNVLVATSSAITFSVNSATTTYTGIYSSSTFPSPFNPASVASTSPEFATSTCNWGDVGCAFGNIYANIMNFIFGINADEISALSGFNFATTPPFSLISQISTQFGSVDASSTMMASSSLSFNIGNGTTSAPFFTPSKAQDYFGGAGTVLRSLMLASLIILMIFGFYREIKSIFKPHA